MNYDYMIYPKQFRTAKIQTENKYCFFLMPFNKNFDYIYGTIKEELMDNGYICNRADELSGSKPIINKILTEILRAQYIIVDLTGCNPNVFYELGITHTFKDAQNVLLLKQKNSYVPFDITHLQYSEYNPNNLKQLSGIIKQFISDNQYINDFNEALQSHGIIGMISDNQNEFVNCLKNELKDDIVPITKMLNYQCRELDEYTIEESLNRYTLFIHKIIKQNQVEMLNGILYLYANILISCSTINIANIHVNLFLTDFFVQHDLPEKSVDEYKTDMAIALAKQEKFIPIVMPWIIGYFMRSKSASIDLNRYKLEAFLMTTRCVQANNAIIDSVFSEDCHIREHMADIIGEKKLLHAKENLIHQLENEKNFYTAVSIIEAIGKIGNESDIAIINRWLHNTEDEIIHSKMFSVFRHAQIAIVRLDKSYNQKHINEFNNLYGKYLSEFVPL